eukprot:GHRQ01027227.1.p1 GENE.GHRQ01027227.1~~GHRQ01027227.1.p1  ORF type:complete len:137 (-),score=33.95 GHRQ01027227.1:477-887(-)
MSPHQTDLCRVSGTNRPMWVCVCARVSCVCAASTVWYSFIVQRCRAACYAGVALSGLLAVLTACQDLKATIGAKHHYLLYCLATAMKPRMLLTVDNEGQLLSVPVRVGQAVDVVAQAGRPKTITGGLLAAHGAGSC